METKYNHNEIEKGKYSYWLEKDYFKCGDVTKTPFTIILPPPNVTGKLHLGHAWDGAIQDAIIRYKRMQGYDCLWLPGMDHAAIATEAKVVAKLKKEGIDKLDLGREKFLKECWNWTHEYSDNIREQWASLGLSLDYSKERFTLDEVSEKAVMETFVKMYKKGLIYRGERIINWDPDAETALSNEEVIYKDDKGALYHLKYIIDGTDDYLEVATTRPETLFGDTAVAVNPKDSRYKKYIGKNVILPIVNKLIPIIADEHADPEFGTGVVKITPAHDPNDYEVGIRHNLERIICINPNGTMNSNALKYVNQDRFVCRENLIKDLEQLGLLIKIEPIVHSVGHSERTNAVVEPYLSKQWFVKMDSLCEKVLNNQKDPDTKVNFFPNRCEKVMNHWMSNCYDWCISRQLWWGFRIPAWYKDDNIYVGIEPPKEEGWIQDEDVLDTWFSSALWPFSTLGWPDDKDGLFKRYFPTNVLTTAYDIIFFWVCRMVFQSLELTNERPFKDCLIHGLIRDKQGRKFSKSLGNGIDPIDMVEKYGADALRLYLTTAVSVGLDLNFDEEKLASKWNFINKLWNASRFVFLNIEDLNENNFTLDNLKNEDKWILSKMNKTIKETTKFMDRYAFNSVGNILTNFVWNDFCDNYIEMAKFSLDSYTTKSVLCVVLTNIIKLLHPFTPFVTDELFNMLPIKDSENIMISNYPVYNKDLNYTYAEKIIDNQIQFIKNFRNTKLENKITSDFKVTINNDKDYDLILKTLKISNKIIKEQENVKSYNVVYAEYDMTIYFENTLTEEELELQEKQVTSLKQSILRRKQLLTNENYLKKAPKELIEKEKNSLQEEEKKLNSLIN
jgi:valyl-tRNA synthetase